MQHEMTDSICALCKNAFAPTADAYPGPSRLCNQCRQLVQTILPRTSLTATVETTAVFDVAGAKETIFADEAKDNLAVEDDFDYREEIDADEPGFFRPEEESHYKTELEMDPDTDEFNNFVEDFPGAPRESVAAARPADDIDDLSDQGSIDFSPSDSFYNEDAASSYDTETAPEARPKVTQGYGAQPASEYFSATTAPLAGETTHEQAQDDFWSKRAETIADTAQMPGPQASSYDEAVTDPWEEPLPAWDYSHNEYPVLLSPKRPTERKNLWVPIAAGLLIVLLVAGYFVLSQPDSPRTDGANTQTSLANAQTSLAEPGGNSPAQAPAASSVTEQQSTPAQTAADTNQAQAPTKPSTEFGSVGTLTLQSAAFPDEIGASEFSEKLIRAGIPAYIVPVDLAGKGRWFRVRVGRFTNADDAKKYAVQSRLRAKAAGMNADFMVVEYGKP